MSNLRDYETQGGSKHNYTHQFYGVDCTQLEYDKINSIEAPTGGWKQATVALELHSIRFGVRVKAPEPVVANSVEATLAQRGSRYGDFTDHARLCQSLISTLQTFKPAGTPAGADPQWNLLDHVKRQALTVICDKLARILTGDPNYDDNWHDIQGYAKLVEDRLPCNINKETK